MVEITADLLTNALNVAATNIATSAATILPGLIAAIVVFILGWIVAVVISRIFASFLKMVKLEEYLKENKIDDALGSVKISNVLVKILKYYILLWVISQALSLVDLGTMSLFLNSLLLYAPALIGALLLILVAAILGEYVKQVIVELGEKSSMVNFTARATKLLIIYIGATMALTTAGFDTSLISSIFLISLQALVYGVALAVGIAFGLGGQKDASDLVARWRKNLKV